MGLVYLGYPKEHLKLESTRVPVTERVTFHGA